MKVKEVSRTANVAWSPPGMQAIHLACGTVAQQLDATFSTSAKLEVFSLDLGTPGPDMTLVGSIDTPHRFHKIVWSGHGMDDNYPKGLIIGGSDNGVITIWSAERVIESSSEATIANITQHTGAVRSLDVNPFQSNLLASGASESEIFIWDLNNPTTPMSPGNKTHPLDDVSGVAWNRQVQHILASTSSGGRSVVWDLRKNEPIIQVADSSSRIQSSGIAWHPDVATQLVTSSVADHSPVIQMWDLRYATAPMRILEKHKRGVLSLAWCPQDSDLLLSAAKDNRVLCWNPNSEVSGGEVVYELPATSQWIFECQWCPRNPAIISTASFDGHVTMYSLLGGGGGGGGGGSSGEKGEESGTTEMTSAPSSGSDFFDGVAGTSPGVPRRQVAMETAPLKTPPKWFRRPCGASFAFGGKLVSFSNTRGTDVPKTINISHVVTEQEFLRKSCDLEDSMKQGKFAEYCEEKINATSDNKEKNIWSFLKVTFEENPRRQYLKLLGYDLAELEKKFAVWSKMSVSTLPAAGGLDVNELSNKLSTVPDLIEDGEGSFEGVGGISDTSSTAAICGSEAGSAFDTISLNDSTTSSKKVSSASFFGGSSTPPASNTSSFTIPTDRDTDGMLSQALLVGNFEAAVDICISADRMAEAMVLAMAGGSDLLRRTQQVFFSKKPTKVSKLISAVVNHNWTEVARYGSLDNWREILAALVTYAGPEDFAPLCDLLGNRLEKEGDGQYSNNASLCYICSGNIQKFVEFIGGDDANDTGNGGSCDALALQSLMEKIVLLRKSVEQQRKQVDQSSSSCKTLNKKMRLYATLLASQGALKTAYDYLSQDKDSFTAILKERLYHAQGLTSAPRPEFPFTYMDIQSHSTPTNPTPSHTPNSAVMETEKRGGMVPTTKQQVTEDQSNPFSRNRGPLNRTGTGRGYSDQTSYVNSAGSQGTFVGQETTNHAPMIPRATLYDTRHLNAPVSTPSIFNPGAAPPVTTTPQGNVYNRTEGAWNDPPLLVNKKVPTSMTTNPAPMPAPIMAPIVTPLQPTQPDPRTTLEPTKQPSPSPIQKAPPPVVQKAPVPQEHEVMVQAFEGMLKRCRSAASNLGTRKKLDDIEKKLSVLYDLLRESRVSPNVIQGLNYMAQSAQNQDYQSGLGCYNQMVSSGNFSEISGFMPGIKTLLNLGIHLRV